MHRLFRSRAVVGCLVLAGLLSLPAASEARPLPGPQPADAGDDALWVPPQALAVLIAHPSRLLGSPEMELMPTEVLAASMQSQFGIDPAQIERLIVLVELADPDGPGFGMLLRFSQPPDLEAIRMPEELFPPGTRWETTQINGRPARQSQGPIGFTLVMINDQIMLAGSSGTLERMLEAHASPRRPGPVQALLSKADLDRDISLLAIMEPVRPMVMQELAQADLPFPFWGLRRVPQLIDSAQLEISMTGASQTTLTIGAASDQAATELDELLGQYLRLGRELLDQQASEAIAEMGEAGPLVQSAMNAYVRRIADRLFDAARPKREGDRLTLTYESPPGTQMASVSTIGVLVGLLLPAVQSAREAARRQVSMNNMKQIALAMHNYESAYKRFPARASRSPDGKPLLSWRVALLPYLEENDLYRRFRLDEPWDSPHNLELIELMPDLYRNPSADTPPGWTSYLAPSGQGGIFHGDEGTRFSQITDGMSNTLLVLEVNPEAGTWWTAPDDLEFDLDNPMEGLGAAHPGGFLAAMADGSVRFLASSIDPEVLRALLTMAGGEWVRIP